MKYATRYVYWRKQDKNGEWSVAYNSIASVQPRSLGQNEQPESSDVHTQPNISHTQDSFAGMTCEQELPLVIGMCAAIM